MIYHSKKRSFCEYHIVGLCDFLLLHPDNLIFREILESNYLKASTFLGQHQNTRIVTFPFSVYFISSAPLPICVIHDAAESAVRRARHGPDFISWNCFFVRRSSLLLASRTCWCFEARGETEKLKLKVSNSDQVMSMDVKENLFWGLVLKPDKRWGHFICIVTVKGYVTTY